MATTEQYAETTVMTGIFFAIVFGVLLLQRRFGGGSEVEIGLSTIVLGLVPFLFFLIVTGRLERLRGGGFGVVLREQAHRAIDGVSDEDIEVVTEKPELKSLEANRSGGNRTATPTTLAFEIGREECYDTELIEEYLRMLSKDLRYILFLDGSGDFEGYVHRDDFETLLGGDTDLVAEIETGSILARPTVNTAAIPNDSSNKTALQEMNRRHIDEVAILDSSGRFVGVVSQDEIVRKLLTNAIREA